MDLRGLTRFSLVDYPGRIGCIAFAGGCNLRCPFCHNPCLVFDPGSQPRVTEKEFFNFLASRRGKLEGVVISGGEPLLQPELGEFIARIRNEGFLVKLDTNGTLPERLAAILSGPGVDALGIDYKAPRARYGVLTGTGQDGLGEKVGESLRLALAAGVELDVRTTVHRALLGEDDLGAMLRELAEAGVRNWMLQQFNPVEVIDDELPGVATWSDAELVRLAKSLGGGVRVRGLHGRVIA